ncbi:putative aldehyde reductase 1 [Rosellinia necatrix]|uniref:Putative aldehyde reductase 1 n=1 Tax=Rosellinia necatrix TaxID=77044 RepID=A0A1W2TMM4_ROSNE|nr:putative aldehyde reductase 1 [Rosellinia necatrix]
MSLGRTLKLNSGYSIPVVGLGTWQSSPNEVARAVEYALRHGYRHIDAAACYGNENEVGEGLRASGVPRSSVFITSKLWNTHHKPEDVEEALDETLKSLGTEYLDLYLIHWPVSFKKGAGFKDLWPINPETGAVHVIDVPNAETWRAMEALVEKGKIRSIGVSNFTKERIEELLKTAKIKPAVNQIEAHPYLQQEAFLEWLKIQGIVGQAYSHTGNNIYGKPKAIDDPVVIEIAESLSRQPAQVLIQWAIKRGMVVLPKSTTASRIEANFQNFDLPEEAFEKINALDRHSRYNFPLRLGVNIFGEHDEETLRRGVEDLVAATRDRTINDLYKAHKK